MGLIHSTILPVDGQMTYVVPNYIQLSENQTNEMLNSGQQPGVPFYLTENGQAIRPKAPRFKVRCLRNTSTIHKSSLELINDNDYDYSIDKSNTSENNTNKKKSLNYMKNPKNIFILSFKYDALYPTELNIYFGLVDKSNYNSISLSDHSLHWGPFTLPPGKNMKWESKDEYRYVNDYNLPSLFNQVSSANSYDIVISLKPKVKKLNAIQNVSINNTSTNNSIITTNTSSVVNQISNHLTNQFSRLFHNYELANTSTDNSKSDVIKSELAVNQFDSTKSIETSDNDRDSNQIHLNQIYSNNDAIEEVSQNIPRNISDFEVTYARVIIPKAANNSDDKDNSEGSTEQSENSSENFLTSRILPNELLLRCILQRIYINNRTYITQEIFGMITKDDVGKTSDNIADNECVICLTNPKTVAGYPCRHTCLCIDCAESLSANGNKCPICRRMVTLLLYMPNDNIRKI